MWLRNGDFSALVSPQGGSVLLWQYKGRRLLGPARMVEIDGELKKRGETHWCYPNFGSVREGVTPHFPQHGYLRNAILRAERRSEAHASFVAIIPAVSPTAKRIWTEVRLQGSALDMELRVAEGRVHGPEKIPVLPALHPYFAVPPDGIAITSHSKGEVLLSSDFTVEPKVVPAVPLTLDLRGLGLVTMDSDAENIVLWSDNNKSYICVEPVFGQPGSYGSAKGRWVKRGSMVTCRVIFTFQPA